MKAARTEPREVAKLTFEEALAELESIVDRLDKGDIELAHSIAAYERGTALRQHCERKLDEARMRVDKITETGGTVPLDPDAAETASGAAP